MTCCAVGDIGNIALLVGATIVSARPLFRFPSESHHDQAWLENGFCVSNKDNLWLNSHSMAFHVGVFFALRAWLMQRSCGKAAPPLAMARVQGPAIGILSFVPWKRPSWHGFATLPGQTADFRNCPVRDFLRTCWRVSRNHSAGVAAQSSFDRSCGNSGILSLGHSSNARFCARAGRDVHCKLVALLVLAGRAEGRSNLRALHGLFQLPALVVGALESARRDDLLKDPGGHVLFDGAIGAGVVAMRLVSVHAMDSEASAKAKVRQTHPAKHESETESHSRATFSIRHVRLHHPVGC